MELIPSPLNFGEFEKKDRKLPVQDLQELCKKYEAQGIFMVMKYKHENKCDNQECDGNHILINSHGMEDQDLENLYNFLDDIKE